MKELVNKQLVIRIGVILAIVTLFVYSKVRDYDFLDYDDNTYVILNSHVNQGLSLNSVKWAFSSLNASTSYWHPLTWLSHMLDCQLFGLNAGYHHAVNVGIHIVNSLLLLTLLVKLTHRIWPSAFVAALLALHPLHVESVAWIAERKDMLSMMFFLLTLIGYKRYTDHPTVWRYLGTVFLAALALMSKPMVVTVPGVLLLLDFWPLGRLQAGQMQPPDRSVHLRRCTLKRLVAEKIPFFVLAVTVAVITVLAQADLGIVKSTTEIPIYLRIANSLLSYCRYIYKMFIPFNLTVYYHYVAHKVAVYKIVGAGLCFVGITACAIGVARKKPYFLVGWLWFLLTLLPVIGLIQVTSQAMADRYAYIPFVGLYIILSWGISDVMRVFPFRNYVLGFTSIVTLSCLSFRTIDQLENWRNKDMLFSHAISVTNDNPHAYANLGASCLSNGDNINGEKYLKYAIMLAPRYMNAYLALAEIYEVQNDYQKAEQCLKRALQLRPVRPNRHRIDINVKLAMLCESQGKLDDALSYLCDAIDSEILYEDTTLVLIEFLIRHKGEEIKHVDRMFQCLETHDSRQNPYLLGALAASNYHTGRIREAIVFAEKALKRTKDKQNDLTKIIQNNLEVYKKEADDSAALIVSI